VHSLIPTVTYILGLLSGVILTRYGVGLGGRIIQRTADGLPAFGKDEAPITQTHTSGIEEEEIEDEL